MSISGRLLIAGAYAYGRAHDNVERMQGSARAFAGAFLGQALDLRERTTLSVALYDATRQSSYRAGQLFDWEGPWFEKRLPPPPAKLLVAGAGAGREVAALDRAGYTIHAFDPAPSAVRDCTARFDGRVKAIVATYEELSATVLDGTSTNADTLRNECYGAVLLGWGSLSHILDPRERRRALQACGTLAPCGPLLCSFRMSRAIALGRSARIGNRLGDSVRRLRGSIPADEGDTFVPEFGFLHCFTEVEIDQLAASVRRQLELDAEAIGYRYATLLPSDTR